MSSLAKHQEKPEIPRVGRMEPLQQPAVNRCHRCLGLEEAHRWGHEGLWLTLCYLCSWNRCEGLLNSFVACLELHEVLVPGSILHTRGFSQSITRQRQHVSHMFFLGKSSQAKLPEAGSNF